MGHQLQKLSAIEVKKKNTPGMYGDGGGLWLQVSSSGAKSWIFRFMLHGKAREMGLGSCNAATLAEARLSAAECRKHLLAGHDPIERRAAERTAQRLESAKAISFEDCASAYIEANKSGWRNPKHIEQWRNTLRDYAHPIFGKESVSDVDTTLVLKALEPIWHTKPETASRLRGRIESVLDHATVRQYRKGDNPARWKGHLELLLPTRSKVAKVEHHAAMPYSQLPAFMTELAKQKAISARALEFTILTAARTGEVIAAHWSEFDLDSGTWIVPAARMKAQREHRVPLSPSAICVLTQMEQARQSDYVFPGARARQPLSNMAMLKVLERMDVSDFTVHGFRSSFRDWAAEQTHHSNEAIEMALAHTVRNKVEAAYRRGDLLPKRAILMNDWAAYLEHQEPPRASVTEIRPAAEVAA